MTGFSQSLPVGHNMFSRIVLTSYGYLHTCPPTRTWYSVMKRKKIKIKEHTNSRITVSIYSKMSCQTEQHIFFALLNLLVRFIQRLPNSPRFCVVYRVNLEYPCRGIPILPGLASFIVCLSRAISSIVTQPIMSISSVGTC